MPQLYRVLYCSRNTVPGSPQEVAAHIGAILAISRDNNARDGITGGLLFSEGCFAQVLEGPQDAVEAAFERIQCDDRHGEVTVLQCGMVAGRDFPDWSMAFTGASEHVVPGIALAGALSGRGEAGADQVLDVLRAVVRRETDWLAPAPQAMQPSLAS